MTDPFGRRAAEQKARDHLHLMREKTANSIELFTPYTAVVTAVSGSLVAIRDVAAASDGGQLIARAAGPAISVGDTCIAVPLRGGGVVAVKTGGDETYYPGSTRAPVPAQQAGRYVNWSNFQALGSLVAVTLTANRAYYLPIYITRNVTANALVFNVATAVSGSVQMAMHSASSALHPGSQLVLSTKTAVSTIGVKSFAVTQALDAGNWYIIGICSTVAMALSGLTAGTAFPAIKGGSAAADGTSFQALTYSDLGAGWTDMPSSPSVSNINNIYLHLSIGL